MADGPIEAIRAGSGTVRYQIAAGAGSSKLPSSAQLREVLAAIKGATKVRELSAPDERSSKVEVVGSKEADIRRELRDAISGKGWELLELRRELPPLEGVFRELTLGADRRERRRAAAA